MLGDYGDIYWDEEEACFLRLSRNFDAFYDELRDLTIDFLEGRGVAFDVDELDEVVRFQSLAIPRPSGRVTTRAGFTRNVLSYFDKLFTTTPIALECTPEVVEVTQPEFAGELPRFARETILWGRKSGTMLTHMRQVDVVGQGAHGVVPVVGGAR